VLYVFLEYRWNSTFGLNKGQSGFWFLVTELVRVNILSCNPLAHLQLSLISNFYTHVFFHILMWHHSSTHVFNMVVSSGNPRVRVNRAAFNSEPAADEASHHSVCVIWSVSVPLICRFLWEGDIKMSPIGTRWRTSRQSLLWAHTINWNKRIPAHFTCFWWFWVLNSRLHTY
jgi:hypothetical protein